MPLEGYTRDPGFSSDKPPRQITDLARVALDLSGTPTERPKTGGPASQFTPYPSPPMSGSPRASQKPASDASELAPLSGNYPPTTASQDVYSGYSTQSSPADSRSSQSYPSAQDLYSRSYPSDSLDRMSYGFPHPGERSSRPPPYLPQGQGLPSISHGAPPQSMPFSSAGVSPQLGGSRPSTVESQAGASPKSQRKAKGHVASACVPCKKAHLRCDSQRPCSRCISNGKEESCHDVVHKKRGRPRLRDDREARYDLSRPPPPHDAAFRRSVNIYPSINSAPPPYGGSLHHQASREIHPQPNEAIAPRHLERNIYPDYNRPLTVSTRPPEPAAYLTMELEFARVSETFLEALGGIGNRRTLGDIVSSAEREKIRMLQHHLSTEQMQREPNYLPPILGRGEQVIQALGFTPDELSRFHLTRREFLTFVGSDGHQRMLPVQVGLAKEGSFYFVVLVLGVSPRPAHPPTPHPAHGYSPHAPPSQPGYGQYGPGPMSQNRHGDHPHGPRQYSTAPQALPPHSHSMGQSTGQSYSAYPARPEYPPASHHHTPRSERHMSTPSQSQSYQLPPIRAPLERPGPSREPEWRHREERPSRVNIDGLIEKNEGPGRPH